MIDLFWMQVFKWFVILWLLLVVIAKIARIGYFVSGKESVSKSPYWTALYFTLCLVDALIAGLVLIGLLSGWWPS